MSNEAELETMKDVYEYTVKDAPDDLIINCSDSPVCIPRGDDPSSSIRMDKGTRIINSQAEKLLETGIIGLVKLNSLTQKNADELEHARRVREGLEFDDLTKKIHAQKNRQAPVVEPYGVTELQRAVKDAREG